MKIKEVEVPPCICAKARWALGITTTRPVNKKTCSQEYWNGIIDHFADDRGTEGAIREAAKGMTYLFRPSFPH